MAQTQSSRSTHTATMDRQCLLGALKGQQMHVPDFGKIFDGWPTASNPNLECLKNDIDDRLKCIVEHQCHRKSEQTLALKKLQAPNYALLGAYWWPWVDDRTLHTLTFLSVWIALWDNVFDVSAGTYDAGKLAVDLEAAQKYRYKTLLYVRQCLHLPSGSYQSRPDDIFITSFEDVAAQVNATCSTEQKERLYVELEQHVVATAERQVKKMSPEVPSVTTYLKIRMQASGVALCLTLLELCEQLQLPSEIRKDANMQKLLDQVNIIILVTSDILSLKSKVGRGNVDNLVALLWLSNSDLDSAASVATSVLDSAKQDFDETARQLVADHLTDGLPNEELESFISDCKAACTGNLIWSLSTRRHEISSCDKTQQYTIVL